MGVAQFSDQQHGAGHGAVALGGQRVGLTGHNGCALLEFARAFLVVELACLVAPDKVTDLPSAVNGSFFISSHVKSMLSYQHLSLLREVMYFAGEISNLGVHGVGRCGGLRQGRKHVNERLAVLGLHKALGDVAKLPGQHRLVEPRSHGRFSRKRQTPIKVPNFKRLSSGACRSRRGYRRPGQHTPSSSVSVCSTHV